MRLKDKVAIVAGAGWGGIGAATAYRFAQEGAKVVVNALPGEAVLSRGAVRAVGGQAGVDRLNRGESGAPQVVVVETYKHFGRFVQDELGRAGVLQRAMLAGRPVGALGY